MVIWSGRGYLVAVVVFISSLLMELITENMTGNQEFYQQSTWPLPLALLSAAGIIFAIGRLAPSILDRGHALFFIPIKYWAPIVAVLSAVALATKL